jgi:hypothetical protein
MSGANLERVRGNVLDRIERFQRWIQWVFVAAALIELAFLAGMVLLTDFKDRVQVLIFISSIAVYTMLALGLMALGAHVSRCTERVLQAIDLTRPERPS